MAPLRTLLSTLLLALAQAAAPADALAQATEDPLGDFLSSRGVLDPGTAGASAADLVLAALNFLDVRYRLGGNDHVQGFDCSSFTRHVFRLALDVKLPRRADEQAQARDLVAVERETLAPGDLVFFNTLDRAFSHVGIFIGGGRFVHAPRSGSAVRVEDMREAYWAQRFDGARRAARFQAGG